MTADTTTDYVQRATSASQVSHHTDLFCDEPDEPPAQQILPAKGHRITIDTMDESVPNPNLKYTNYTAANTSASNHNHSKNGNKTIPQQSNTNTHTNSAAENTAHHTADVSNSDLSSFKIFVRTITGRTITLENVTSLTTILELKQKLQDQEGIPPMQQRLIYGGKVIADDNRCSDYKIHDGVVLNLVLQLSNAPEAVNTSTTNIAENADDNNNTSTTNGGHDTDDEGVFKMIMGASMLFVCCILCCVIPIMCAVDIAALVISSSYNTKQDVCQLQSNQKSYVIDLQVFLNVGGGIALASYLIVFPVTMYVLKKIAGSLYEHRHSSTAAPNPAAFIDLSSPLFTVTTVIGVVQSVFLLIWSAFGMYIYSNQLSADCKHESIAEIILAWSIIRFVFALCGLFQQRQQRKQIAKLQNIS